MNIDAIIEIPMGSKNKYEIIKEDHYRIKLDRVLYSSMQYPAEYGYIENTLAGDGDALDILILSNSPTFPGCIVNARVLGYLELMDGNRNDEKIIAVPNGDPRFNEYTTVNDIPSHTREEIKEFFRTYKDLQNIKTEIGEYHDANDAEALIAKYKDNYQKKD